MMHLSAALLMVATPPAIPAPAAVTMAQVGQYSVIFEIRTDEAGKLLSIEISQVIDPKRGTAPVTVDVEAEWLAAARADLMKRTDWPVSKTFYMYRFYTPGIPYRP